MIDREVLRRPGMAVFEAAVAEPLRLELPAPADRGHGVGRRPAALVQAVERKRAFGARRDGRDLLDAKIVGLLFELHGPIVASGRRNGAKEKRGKTKRPREVEPKTVAQSASDPCVSLGLWVVL